MLDNKSSIIFTRGDIHSRQIALTYDCGGIDMGRAVEILDVLKEHEVRATFFLTGEWVENHPELSRRIVDDGHDVGNHSYDHPDMTRLSPEDIRRQICEAEASIYRVTGEAGRPLFRLPFGAYNKQVLEILGDMGFDYSIHWSIGTLGWHQQAAKIMVSRTLKKVKNGDIVLMQVLGQGIAEVSDLLIPELKQRNYELVTVGSMLKTVIGPSRLGEGIYLRPEG